MAFSNTMQSEKWGIWGNWGADVEKAYQVSGEKDRMAFFRIRL